MLSYKLFSSFKIDRAMIFLSKQVAREGQVFFPVQKIPAYLIFCFYPELSFLLLGPLVRGAKGHDLKVKYF